jgi:enamine deaminase RidA (YjgF/YER057c/UK114 family)
MPREIIQPEGIFSPRGKYPYEQVCKHGKHIYVAGQLAFDIDGNLVGRGDIAAQTRQVFKNLRGCLACAGATFGDVVKINVFSTDIDGHLPLYAPIRAEFFENQNVPSSYVQVPRLAHPDCLIEIEATAILD